MTSCHNILSNIIKPWAVQAAGQQFVYFNYNPVGDNTKVYSSLPNDWERNYTYDWLGRRLTYWEGELAESYTYNGGQISSHSQSWMENGITQSKTTTYHYNAHRLDSVCYDDALTTIYHYNAAGQPDSVYDESGVMCYEYGDMGEVTQETRIYALPFLTNPLALSTQFTYDSWGRIQDITYPDNEVVSYGYDLGGQLQSITNNSSNTYLDNVTYDKFGAKVSQTYGNGLVTDYDYDNTNRRLTSIITSNGTSINYTYDLVGNVTQVNSNYPWLQNPGCNETFTYDASDQLVAAVEQGGGYSLAVTYGDWGKVNTYDLTQTDMLQNTATQEAYTFGYPANPNSLQQEQTMFAPAMQYGGTGGMQAVTAQYTFGINGSLRKKEHLTHNNPVEYYLFNSAANLKAYSNNGIDFAYYGYNAANTRTYKLNFLNANSWVNGQQLPIHPQSIQAMFYPNAYLNFNQNGEYTKHYYNGSERIASRLGNTALSISMEMTDRLQERVGKLEICFQNDIQTLVYTNVQVETPPVSATSLQQTGTPTDIFYYHTNLLGSTAYVTDNNAIITQGFLYAPFGEITTEYNANFGNNVLPKYSFNAKELDEETGMYYYEARYYKPPVFTSRDAMFEKYFWMTPYAYCANNPVKYVDPDGREWDLSFLTDEQKAVWEKAMTKACDNSELFKFIYNQLDESSIKYTVKIGLTSYENGHYVDGQYNSESQTFTFLNEESMKKFSAFSEEMFHAYQLTENNGKYDIGDFNYEFEAKFAKHIMSCEGFFPGSGDFYGMKSFITQFEQDFNFGSTFTSKSINETFLSTYRKAANDYAKYNKSEKIGNDEYKTATTVNPYSLIIMINSVRP